MLGGRVKQDFGSMPFIRNSRIILLLLFLATEVLHSQSQLHLRQFLFGVRLDPGTSSLLAEVEKTYGKPVHEEWLSQDNPSSGYSKVADDGTPVIYINPQHGRNHDVILHELYHFQLRTRGYPVINWLFPQYMNIEANIAAFDQLREQLYDPILHYLCYPEVRASFGIHPGETLEQRTRDGLDSLASVFARMDRGAVALYFFRMDLEFADTQLVKRILALLETHSLDGIEFGKQLVQVVRKVNPRSPEEAIEALVSCLNLFHKDQFQFQQHPWTSRQLGQHTQQLAPIQLTPVK